MLVERRTPMPTKTAQRSQIFTVTPVAFLKLALMGLRPPCESPDDFQRGQLTGAGLLMDAATARERLSNLSKSPHTPHARNHSASRHPPHPHTPIPPS